jgi:hypothetical protein
LNKTKEIANQMGAIDSVFTFENNFISVFKGNSGLVNTFDERIEKLEKLKVKSVISTVFTKDFSLINAEDFLDRLFANFDIKAIVCGKDYKFGAGGLGTVELLFVGTLALLGGVDGKRVDATAKRSGSAQKLAVSIEKIVLVCAGVNAKIIGTIFGSAFPHGAELVFVQFQLDGAFHEFLAEHNFFPFNQ